MQYGKSSNAFNDEDDFDYGDDYDSQEEESMDDVVQRQLLMKQQ